MVAGAVALTCAGGLLGAWTYLGVSQAEPVVAMRVAVQRGEVIERGDLVTARINADPALHPVPVSEGLSLVGKRAAADLPAGTLVTRDAVTSAVVPRAGFSVVGLGLEPGLFPGGTLATGDRVRVIGVVGAGVRTATSETVKKLAVPAEIVSAHQSQSTTKVVLDVLVPEGDAAQVAAAAAAGQVAVVLDSRER